MDHPIHLPTGPRGRNAVTCALGTLEKSPVLRGLAGVCVLAYLPSLFEMCSGAWPFAGDAVAQTASWRQLTLGAFGHGVLPLWNPHLFCGMPFMSTGQSGVLYPANVVYWLLPLKPALFVDALSHNVALACGAYGLARALRLSRGAAVMTALSLALGGAVSAHLYAGHLTWHAARAYLPWELWALLCYLRTARARYVYFLAAAFSLQMASGYPPYVLFSAGLCGGLCLAWCASFVRSARSGASHLLLSRGARSCVLIAVVLIATTGAVNGLPLLELSRLTPHGSGLPYAEAIAGSGTWHTLLRLMAPGFFGGTDEMQWSTPINPHEETAYQGLITLVLALGAPVLARRAIPGAGAASVLPRPVWWLWALLLVSALLALGGNTPLYGWLYRHVIFFRITRVPARWLEAWCLAASLLAGFSFDGCRDPRRGGARAAAIALAVLAVAFLLLVCALLATRAASPLWMAPAQSVLHHASGDSSRVLQTAAGFRVTAVAESFLVFLLAASGAALLARWHSATVPDARRRAAVLIIGFVAADVTLSFWRNVKTISAEEDRAYLTWPAALTRYFTPGQRWSTRLNWMAVDRCLAAGVDSFGGYDAMSSRRFFDFEQALDGPRQWDGVLQPEHRPPLLRVPGVTYTLAQAAIPLGADRNVLQPVARLGNWSLWRHPEPWPRVYLSRRVIGVPEGQQLSILNGLAARPRLAGALPVVAAPGAFASVGMDVGTTLRGSAAPAGPGGRVGAWQRGLNQITVRVTTTQPSVVVMGEAWYPGWRAWVNGRAAALERVNFMFRGVQVPRGESQVCVVYEPETLRFALFLSLCGSTLCGAAAAAWRDKGQRRPHSS